LADDDARREPSDDELVEMAGPSSGDAASRLDAFLRLFERHREAASSYAARMTGDLAAADALVREGFAASAAQLAGPRRAPFRTLLFAALVRAVRKHLEANRVPKGFGAFAGAGGLPKEKGEEDLLADAATFYGGLERRDVRQREAVCLRLLGRMGLEEAAAVTGSEPQELKRLLGGAVEALKVSL
jgi:DNA-directed RNA polymerase specialized sigma24 family protein